MKSIKTAFSTRYSFQDQNLSEISENQDQNIIDLCLNLQMKKTKSYTNSIQIKFSSIKQKQRILLIFVPISIASSGKTTMFNNIQTQKNQYFTKIVSSDGIRAVVMQRISIQNPNLTQPQIFSKSNVQTNEKFYISLQQFIADFAQNSQKQKGIILVDKNHQEKMIKKTVNCVKKCIPKHQNIKIKIIGLIPKCDTFIQSKQCVLKYPFSYSLALTAMKRVISRNQHQTLSGSQQYKVSIVANFINCFRNFPLQQDYLKNNYFDQLCFAKFNNQKQAWTQDIKILLFQILSESEPQNFAMHKLIPKLTNALKCFSYVDINKEQSVDYLMNKIQTIFNSFINKNPLNTKVQQINNKRVKINYVQTEYKNQTIDRPQLKRTYSMKKYQKIRSPSFIDF